MRRGVGVARPGPPHIVTPSCLFLIFLMIQGKSSDHSHDEEKKKIFRWIKKTPIVINNFVTVAFVKMFISLRYVKILIHVIGRN